jgi:putative lipoprotein
VSRLADAFRFLAAVATGGGLALLTAPGWAAAQGGAQVTGEVLYRERIALPPSARVNVQLQDVSRAGAPAVVLAEQNVDPAGRAPPYAFALPYDPARTNPAGSHVVRAQIRDGDTLLFTSTTSYQVITRGNPTSGLQVIVQRVAGGPGAPPAVGLPATGGGGGGGAPSPFAPAALFLPAAVLMAAVLMGAGMSLRRSRGAS